MKRKDIAGADGGDIPEHFFRVCGEAKKDVISSAAGQSRLSN